MDRNEMRFTAALALLRDGIALMTAKGMNIKTDDITSAIGFAVESADDLLRELDEADKGEVKSELEAVAEPPVTKAQLLAEDALTQALYEWSSQRIDEASCRAQAKRYLNGLDVSPLIKTVFEYAVNEAKDKV